MNKLKDFIIDFIDIVRYGQRKDQIIGWCIILLICGFLVFNTYSLLSPDKERHVDTYEFMQELESGNVAELHISNSDGTVSGKFKEPNENGVIAFNSNVPERNETFTSKYLENKDVEYDYSKQPAWVTALASLIRTIAQLALIIGAMYWLLKMQMGEGKGFLPFVDDDDFGVVQVPDTTFDDVVGIPEAIEEMEEIVTFLKSPEVYNQAGAKCPHGVLLAGDSGVGKTLLARALAGEAGVKFIAASGSDFVKIYVGQGAKRVRELFAKARKIQPAIIFIDEIDAVGGNRNHGTGMHDEHLQTINALLTELDGFSKDDHIIVVAATNRSSSLDPALIRPGRFDRIITIDTPAKEGRKEILRHYAQDKPFEEMVDFDMLAAHTSGFSGAQLENVINQAATLAARRASQNGQPPRISSADLEEGIARTLSGPALKSKQMSQKEKEQVAYHEAGHAVVQYLLPECDPVQKISIVSRHIPTIGTAMGYVQSYSEEDKYIETSEQLYSELAALLAGRCAEQMYCNIESTGAYNDLERASKIAVDIVTKYAFEQPGEEQSLRVITKRSVDSLISEKTKEHIDANVDAILDRAYKTTKRIVASNRVAIEHIVQVLLEEETIDSLKIKEIMEEHLPDEM